MNIIYQTQWKFPPTLNRKGMARSAHDIKTVMVVQSNLFRTPTVAMSDIHSHTASVVNRLSEFIKLAECTVITAGDMAGALVYGSDADPTEDLLALNRLCKEFYYVHGNHDAPVDNNVLRRTQNAAGRCISLDVANVETLGGVDGTVSDRAHINKFPRAVYLKKLERVLRQHPTILVTHETPSIPKYYASSGDRYTGREDVYELVGQYRPKVHMYGHCHHPEPFNLIDGVQYVNLDARIVIFVDSEEIWDALKL